MNRLFINTLAPSDKLNIVGVGIGGIGGINIDNCNRHNIMALCDVDWDYASCVFKKYPKAKKYKDFRKMFDELEDQIDAVIIATPDHTHATIAALAMKMGKHVYVQKPLAHSIYESRTLATLAAHCGVATQMGNQGNSDEGIRQICEWIWDDAIGEVIEAHAWTNRPIWIQGFERPAKTFAVPSTLDWDLFIGPAPWRSYHPTYTPWNWRAWWDFGTGDFGDMGGHIFDSIYKALLLEQPDYIYCSSSPFSIEGSPMASAIHFEFPERKKYKKINMPATKVSWYAGGVLPPRPAELKDGEPLGDFSGGCLFVGTKGKLICGALGRNPRLLPEELDRDYRRPEPSLRRITNAMNGGHEKDWLRSCRESVDSRIECSSYFGYSGPMNEVIMLGNLAIRLQDLKRKLKWNGDKMQITNISRNDKIKIMMTNRFRIARGHPSLDTQYSTINARVAAEEYIKHHYRKGWEL